MLPRVIWYYYFYYFMIYMFQFSFLLFILLFLVVTVVLHTTNGDVTLSHQLVLGQDVSVFCRDTNNVVRKVSILFRGHNQPPTIIVSGELIIHWYTLFLYLYRLYIYIHTYQPSDNSLLQFPLLISVMYWLVI